MRTTLGWCCSNHGAPINIEDGDRRYFVFKSNALPKEDAYYDQLYQFIDSQDGMDAIYTFFQKRDLSRFNAFRRPPMTTGKNEIIEDSVHPLRTHVIESVQSGHFFRKLTKQFTFVQLQQQLDKDGYGAQAKNMRELGEALKAAGIVQSRPLLGARRFACTRCRTKEKCLSDPHYRSLRGRPVHPAVRREAPLDGLFFGPSVGSTLASDRASPVLGDRFAPLDYLKRLQVAQVQARIPNL